MVVRVPVKGLAVIGLAIPVKSHYVQWKCQLRELCYFGGAHNNLRYSDTRCPLEQGWGTYLLSPAAW